MNKHIRSGFTLIELMVAITITGFMAYALVQIYSSMERASSFITYVIEEDTAQGVIDNQFEKDITGIFVPLHWSPIKPKKDEPTKPPAQQKEQGKPEKKLELIPYSHALVSINDGDQLQKMSFITNNPLQVYGQTKPKIARIEYILEPMENVKGYRLKRSESSEYDMEKFEESNPRSFTLLDNIKTMKVDFFAFKQPPQEKDKKAQKDKKEQEGEEGDEEEPERKKLPEHVWLPTWDDEIFETNKEIIPGLLPLSVHITLQVYKAKDPNREMYTEYQFYYLIYAADSGLINKKQEGLPDADQKGKKEKEAEAKKQEEAKKKTAAQQQQKDRAQQRPGPRPTQGGVKNIAAQQQRQALGG